MTIVERSTRVGGGTDGDVIAEAIAVPAEVGYTGGGRGFSSDEHFVEGA